MSRWVVHLQGERRPRCVTVAVGHKVYSFDSSDSITRYTNTIRIDVFNTVSLRWKTLPPTREGQCPLQVPTGRHSHTAVLIGDVVYIFGGFKHTFIADTRYRYRYHGGHCNDLYAFDVDTHTWSLPKVSGTAPEKSQSHMACVLRNVMYVCGVNYKHIIYKLDTAAMVWSFIDTRGSGTPEPPSWYNSDTIIGTKMFACGAAQHVSVFDTESNFWLSTPSAQLPSEGRLSSYYHYYPFAYNGELYIFLNDLWKFNPETFSWKKVAAKGKGPMSWRFGMPLCCCIVGDRIIFGRQNTPTDLYILDMSPSLKTLCKLAVIQYGLDQAELPHDIRWELAAMTNSNRTCKSPSERNMEGNSACGN